MEEVIAAIREVQEELSIPRATKTRLDEVVAILEGPGDNRLKASKAISEIEELSDNANLPSFVRTQLWNIASMLEMV